MSKVWKLFTCKGSNVAYALITLIFTVFPEKCFEIANGEFKWLNNIFLSRVIVCFVIVFLSHIVCWLYAKKRRSVYVDCPGISIQIEYGNLFESKNGKIIIDFDECFTTRVGDAPGDIKAESICGQYLRRYFGEDMQGLIEKVGVKPAYGKSEYMNKTRYVPGTIVPNGRFLLMAFARLDKDGLGHLTYGEYVECLNTLWKQMDMHHGTSDVYMPILGSKIVRFDKELSQQELLDTIIASYRVSPYKLKESYSLHIVCRERKDFSLNDVFGVK